jgi:hypothetical protein
MVKAVSENCGEDFCDKRGGSYDVRFKIRGVSVILNLC